MQELVSGTTAIVGGLSALLGAGAAFLTAWLKGKNSLNEQIDRRIIMILEQKDQTIKELRLLIAEQNSEHRKQIEARDQKIADLEERIARLEANR